MTETDGIDETESIMGVVLLKLGGTLPVLTHEVFRKALGQAYMRGRNDALVAQERPQRAEATQ